MLAFLFSPNNIRIKSRGPISKSSCITPAYHPPKPLIVQEGEEDMRIEVVAMIVNKGHITHKTERP